MTQRQNSHPIKACKILPAAYQQVREINLKKNIKLAVLLNLLSIPVLLISGIVLYQLVRWLRPGSLILPTQLTLDLIAGFALIAWVIGLSVLMLVLHEAIHGGFFWLTTHEKVRFAFKGAYAYAASPDWYFPRSNYLLTCLAPFVLISLGGLLALLAAPQTWLWYIFYFVITNAAGATGDLYIALVQLGYPPDTYYQDQGDVFTIYRPVSDSPPQ
jgi:hypothetical protein